MAANDEVRFQLSGSWMHLVNNLAHHGTVFQCASNRTKNPALKKNLDLLFVKLSRFVTSLTSVKWSFS